MLVTVNLSTDPPPLKKNEGRGGLRGGRGCTQARSYPSPKSPFCPKGRTIRKVMGWGGGGIFEPQEFFFVIRFLV